MRLKEGPRFADPWCPLILALTLYLISFPIKLVLVLEHHFLVTFLTLGKNQRIFSTGLETGCKPDLLSLAQVNTKAADIIADFTKYS